MGWSWLQSAAGNNGTGAGTVAATYSTANLSSGTKLIALVTQSGAVALTVSGVALSGGGTFTLMATAVLVGNAGTSGLSLWQLDTPAGAAGTKPTVTATITGGTPEAAILVQEVSGLVTGTTVAAVVDGTPGTLTGNTNTATGSPSYTSTAASEFLLACYGDTGGPLTWVKPAALTIDAAAVNSSAANDVAIAYGNSTNGTEAGSWGLSGTATQWGAFLLAFKVTAAAAPAAAQPPAQPGATWRHAFWHPQQPQPPGAAAVTTPPLPGPPAAQAQPGATWRHAFWHPQQPQPVALAPFVPAAAQQPQCAGPCIFRSRPLARAITGSSGLPAAGVTGPPPPPPPPPPQAQPGATWLRQFRHRQQPLQPPPAAPGLGTPQPALPVVISVPRNTRARTGTGTVAGGVTGHAGVPQPRSGTAGYLPRTPPARARAGSGVSPAGGVAGQPPPAPPAVALLVPEAAPGQSWRQHFWHRQQPQPAAQAPVYVPPAPQQPQSGTSGYTPRQPPARARLGPQGTAAAGTRGLPPPGLLPPLQLPAWARGQRQAQRVLWHGGTGPAPAVTVVPLPGPQYAQPGATWLRVFRHPQQGAAPGIPAGPPFTIGQLTVSTAAGSVLTAATAAGGVLTASTARTGGPS